MQEYEQILEKIEEIRKTKGRCIVSIDGRCTSGKSTLGTYLKEKTGGELIRMDDFFLRQEQRTPQRYNTPGENVDHERFTEEVLLPLAGNEAFVYYPFDHSVMGVGSRGVQVQPSDVVIIEGSYSQRPDLKPYYDLNIFLTVGPEEQMRRIEKRNPDKVEMFRTKWIPLEEAYFSAFHPEASADLVIHTDSLTNHQGSSVK